MEIFKEIKGFELYEVSNLGNVKTKPREKKNSHGSIQLTKEKILKPFIKKTGYAIVILYQNDIRKMQRIHRLVANAFIPNPENKPEVNHINGDKSDNRLQNLEWVTPKENIYHGFKTGLITRNKKMKVDC